MIKKILVSIILLLSTAVWSNEYKFIVMNPPGSGPDLVARKISQIVKEQSAIDLIVFNQGQAGGIMAAREFKNERLAVAIANTSMLIYGPLAGNNELSQSYNINDFNLIADLGLAGSVWFTYPGSGINNAQDLIRVLPTLKHAAIGVASQDSMANAKAFVKRHKLEVPVVMYKNNNEPVIQVAGKHLTVAVVFMNTESIWSTAKKGDINILGYSGTSVFNFRDFSLTPLAKDLDIPAFYGGSWLAVTPGNTSEHIKLRLALLRALQDPAIKNLVRQAWPLGDAVPFKQVVDTAIKNQDLFK